MKSAANSSKKPRSTGGSARSSRLPPKTSPEKSSWLLEMTSGEILSVSLTCLIASMALIAHLTSSANLQALLIAGILLVALSLMIWEFLRRFARID